MSGPQATAYTADTSRRPRAVAGPVTALLDVVAIAVFVVIGRSEHRHGLALLGLAQTFWPFLAGAAAGWSVYYVYSRVRSADWFGGDFHPQRILPAGLVIWFCTVTVGMVLRFLLHQGVAVSFVIVAAVVLGVFLLGWRAVAAWLVRR